MTLTIQSNTQHTSDVLISDLGIYVPGSGGSITLDSSEDILEARSSNELRALLTDDAYGVNSSTLFLVDASDGVVPQDSALNYLDSVGLANDGPYSVVVRDKYGNIPVSGSGINETQHEQLAQLIHFIHDGPTAGFGGGPYYREIIGSPFPSSVTWYTNSTKQYKLLEVTITRNSNKTPSSVEWKIYDTDGVTVLQTVVDNISYNGLFESSRERIRS